MKKRNDHQMLADDGWRLVKTTSNQTHFITLEEARINFIRKVSHFGRASLVKGFVIVVDEKVDVDINPSLKSLTTKSKQIPQQY